MDASACCRRFDTRRSQLTIVKQKTRPTGSVSSKVSWVAQGGEVQPEGPLFFLDETSVIHGLEKFLSYRALSEGIEATASIGRSTREAFPLRGEPNLYARFLYAKSPRSTHPTMALLRSPRGGEKLPVSYQKRKRPERQGRKEG